MLTAKNLILKLGLGIVLLIVVMILATLIGTQKVSLTNAFFPSQSSADHNADYDILIGIRLPRVILAALVGAALASAGVILQAILKTPSQIPIYSEYPAAQDSEQSLQFSRE